MHSLRQIILLFLVLVLSCEDDQPDTSTIVHADFSYEIDYFTVKFTDRSRNAQKISWDFGDGKGNSIQDSPDYEYAYSGEYEVTLIAIHEDGSSDTARQSIVLVDIGPVYSILSGEKSKTWKLFREGPAILIGPNASEPEKWFKGFYNDGTRPCVFRQSFTFQRDGVLIFDANDEFWGYDFVYDLNSLLYQSCFVASVETMTVNGEDLSLWDSGVYQFETTEQENLTIYGKGAWIGMPFLGTDGTDVAINDSVSCLYNVQYFVNYELLLINFNYGDAGYWTIRYAHYPDSNDEPNLVE